MRPTDVIEILAEPVQSVPLERFASLGLNDVLFIDSSHMLKTASDVHYIVTEVLPILSEGVYVHFHDIFWPFEYPRKWVEKGIAWNECYLLHGFVLFNDDFEIALWNHWLGEHHTPLLMSKLPAMLENTGGASGCAAPHSGRYAISVSRSNPRISLGRPRQRVRSSPRGRESTVSRTKSSKSRM